jgi:hypothetical protein
MIERKTNSPLLRAARRDQAKVIEQAGSTTLLQLSVALALATVSVISAIACVKWLLS